ncbi:L-aspartate oxidase [Prolixibacteraceae bacterium]|nr:L-aspartate oxidase [Prolixibacteraceae bacterium]
MEIFHFDYIVVGSGLAGLATAYHASKYGNVAILTKSAAQTSNSHYAQGGIACVYDKEDKVETHVEDTLIAGRGLCNEEAVNILVKEGIDRVKEVIDLGMIFDKNDNGEIILGLEGGHSHRRILHAGGDETGARLTSFMLDQVHKLQNVTIFENMSGTALLHQNNIAAGIMASHQLDGNTNIFIGKNTVIASGGISKVYSRSTNPETATGDGVSMAIAAGVDVQDLEFIQFHPSALSIKGKPSFLISEAIRGEGAHLLNSKGERFMLKQHPNAELAPRDVVASAIFREMQKENSNFVCLSIKHLNGTKMQKRFQSINRFLLKNHIDFTKQDIPVAPAAHYMVGGITTGIHGQTSMQNLYAVGEVASTGVMGANRLASNSLLECLVFAHRAVIHSKNSIKDLPSFEIESFETHQHHATKDSLLQYQKIVHELSDIMMQKVGIIRDATTLSEAKEALESLKRNTPDKNSTEGTALIQRINSCLLMVKMAISRKESRGGHIRNDYPNSNESFRKHTKH